MAVAATSLSYSVLSGAGCSARETGHFKVSSTRAEVRRSNRCVSVRANSESEECSQAPAPSPNFSRRISIALAATVSALPLNAFDNAVAAQKLPAKDTSILMLCDEECLKKLDSLETVKTASGLAYKDIVVGKGPSPPIGFQVAANYVAMLPNGAIFDSSLEKRAPYIFRVGSGQVIPGLDEGLLSMRVGGLRRLYIPGELAFPKGLGAAAGRPRVPPSSPVMFDVNLLYIPGLEDELEE